MLHFSKLIPKLIIGSVFVEHEKAEFWYNLQIEYLKKTTKNFKHVVCINGNINPSIFKYSEIIHFENKNCSKSNDGLEQSKNHFCSIEFILKYFKNNFASDYLLLDSDCFPIKDNWQDILKSKMKNFKFSSPFRFENLDCFPHPCAFFIDGKNIADANLDFKPTTIKSLIGHTIMDNGCGIPKSSCYPLIRSNFINKHPIFCAIYNHIFYHHGCGSRNMMPRSVLFKYFDHYLDEKFHHDQMVDLFTELQQDPEKFINLLAGNKL